MSVRKKFFLATAVAMLTVLCLSYIVIYFHLYNSSYEKVVAQQRNAVELNLELTNSFVESVYYTATQVVSDKTLGEYLSTEENDTLSMLRYRSSIQQQFGHYSANQAVNSSYFYRNTLYLSDQIPIASVFEDYTLDHISSVSSSTVLSNANVKNQEWYKETVEQISYVFYNKGSDEFCIARKLNNTYYQGAYLSEGQAVLVVSVAMDQLDRVLSSVPITVNSGYALLGSEDSVLFCSNPSLDALTFQKAYEQYQKTMEDEFEISIDGKKYLFSHRPAEYGIELLFLVPHSDIAADISPIMLTYSLLFLCITALTLIAIYILAGKLTKPLIELSDAIGSIKDARQFTPDLLPRTREKEILMLEGSFEDLVGNVNLLIENIAAEKEKEKLSQLRALQAQINPHFIFNAMDMVNWLALSHNCDDIAEIVNSIAELMRYSITDADGTVTIASEMENIQIFLSIYQLRHNNRLHLTSSLESEDILIPKFILQPLVENAVRHASPPPGKDLIITVLSFSRQDEVVIEVTDNGIVHCAEQLNRHLNYEDSSLKISSGFGVRNVNERIHLKYGTGSGLSYHDLPEGGLTARITLHIAK